MRARAIERHTRAREDVRSALDFYLVEAGEAVALAFIEAVDTAFQHVAEMPMTGSSRLGQEVGLPGLRSWPLKRFPYHVFYFDHGDRITVWRVLHSQRDLPKTLSEPG
ncbi:MAG: type II toxin-antitoxin system RelE/ParE family toxin [Alphaproteobacteria bacterium]|nr:type II toxin-antitoxin system RelE/ParE family toxin [Alphaproteobacteria bacterium]MBU2380078.1 type II toxin-antitoxin system RelE/ParE family toxin [Alphaproteobacteria bacterium]